MTITDPLAATVTEPGVGGLPHGHDLRDLGPHPVSDAWERIKARVALVKAEHPDEWARLAAERAAETCISYPDPEG